MPTQSFDFHPESCRSGGGPRRSWAPILISLCLLALAANGCANRDGDLDSMAVPGPGEIALLRNEPHYSSVLVDEIDGVDMDRGVEGARAFALGPGDHEIVTRLHSRYPLKSRLRFSFSSIAGDDLAIRASQTHSTGFAIARHWFVVLASQSEGLVAHSDSREPDLFFRTDRAVAPLDATSPVVLILTPRVFMTRLDETGTIRIGRTGFDDWPPEGGIWPPEMLAARAAFELRKRGTGLTFERALAPSARAVFDTVERSLITTSAWQRETLRGDVATSLYFADVGFPVGDAPVIDLETARALAEASGATLALAQIAHIDRVVIGASGYRFRRRGAATWNELIIDDQPMVWVEIALVSLVDASIVARGEWYGTMRPSGPGFVDAVTGLYQELQLSSTPGEGN